MTEIIISQKPKLWIPLHVHSEYSALDGAVKISSYYKNTKKYRLPACAVTDHGNMSSHFEMDRTFADIKPIFGCESYAGSMLSRNIEGRNRYHLNVYAKNEKGYSNLRKLISSGYKTDDEEAKGPYYITRSAVEEYSDGLIFATACMSGELSVLLTEGLYDDAKKFADFMCGVVGRDNFYVEILDIGWAVQDNLNKLLLDFAEANNLNPIITTDSHYLTEDKTWYNYLVAAQKKQTIPDDGTETSYDWDLTGKMDLSLRSPEIIYDKWSNLCPKAVENTLRFAESIERIDLKGKKYMLPEISGDTEEFISRAKSGLEEHLEKYSIPVQERDSYYERLNRELDVVAGMNFIEYFSLVEDVVKSAKHMGIKVGLGRGSAAGSILAWSLGITEVDPVKYGLIFERFLNPERVGMPDIDIDVEDERRGDVISYLKKKYGSANVAGIINFSRSGWKMSIRDAARVLSCQPWQGDALCKALEGVIDSEGDDASDVGVSVDILKANIYKKFKGQKFAQLSKEKVDKVIELAGKFTGLIRNYGKHASGLVVTPGRIDDFVAMSRVKGSLVTMADMDGIDYIKLVKLDILGLSTLSMLKEIEIKSVEIGRKYARTATPTMDDFIYYANKYGMDGMPNFTDAVLETHGFDTESARAAMSLFDRGATTGVFQFASPGMRNMLRKICPADIRDLSAAVALYRPGPLNSGLANEFIVAAKKGHIQSKYPEEIKQVVDEIAKDAHGITIYQEHIMRIAREIAGYSLGQADLLRKAMGKKKPEIMEKEKSKFIEGAVRNGYSKETAEKTFETIGYFAGYGFNKSHSVCYAILAFITAWYQANRAALFWAALLNDTVKKQSKDAKGRDKVSPILAEAYRDVNIMPPQFFYGENWEQKISETTAEVTSKSYLENSTTGDWSFGGQSSERKKWTLRLGLNMVKRASAYIGRINELKISAEDTIEDVLRKGLNSTSESAVAATGPMFLNGFFDKVLANTLIKCNVPIAPIYMRLAILEMGRANIPEKMANAIKECCSRLSPRNDGTKLPFKIVQSRSVFGSFMDYAVKRLRALLNPDRRKPWKAEDLEHWMLFYFWPFQKILAEEALNIKKRMHCDLSYRVRMIHEIWRIEKETFGEGIFVPDWGCAAELLGWSFVMYADEAYKYLESHNHNANLDKLAGEQGHDYMDYIMYATIGWEKSKEAKRGIWILGYFDGYRWYEPGTEAGKGVIKLKGRYGDSDDVLNVYTDKRLPLTTLDTIKKIASSGNYVALKVFYSQENNRGCLRLFNDGTSVYNAGISGLPESFVIIPMSSDLNEVILLDTGNGKVVGKLPDFRDNIMDRRSNTLRMRKWSAGHELISLCSDYWEKKGKKGIIMKTEKNIVRWNANTCIRAEKYIQEGKY